MSYRELCLNEKGEECYICGSGGEVQVHHIDGDRANNDLENLIPVCKSCHGKIHNNVDDYEEWYERILPKEERTRRISLKTTPEDQESTKVIKEVTPADSDQQAIKLAIRHHSNKIEALGERKDLLAELQDEFGSVGEEALINAALTHLIQSRENMDSARDELDPRTIQRFNTDVLALKYRTSIEERWR